MPPTKGIPDPKNHRAKVSSDDHCGWEKGEAPAPVLASPLSLLLGGCTGPGAPKLHGLAPSASPPTPRVQQTLCQLLTFSFFLIFKRKLYHYPKGKNSTTHLP